MGLSSCFTWLENTANLSVFEWSGCVRLNLLIKRLLLIMQWRKPAWCVAGRFIKVTHNIVLWLWTLNEVVLNCSTKTPRQFSWRRYESPLNFKFPICTGLQSSQIVLSWWLSCKKLFFMCSLLYASITNTVAVLCNGIINKFIVHYSNGIWKTLFLLPFLFSQ